MEQGLWKLFFATGLPQAYLAIRGAEEEREAFFRSLAPFAAEPPRQA